MLAGQGVPVFRALLISGVWPAGKSVMSLSRQRRVDEFSAFILTLIILGTLSSLLPFDHERVRQRVHRAEGNARLTRGQHRVG